MRKKTIEADDVNLYSEQQIRDLLGLSKHKTRRLFHTEGFNSFFVGRDCYITKDNLLKFFDTVAGKRFMVRYSGVKEKFI